MNEHSTAWHSVGSASQLATLVRAAMQNATRGLSDMVGRYIVTGTSEARVISFAEMTTYVGDPESAMVGIYLLMQGDLNGQAIMIFPLDSALNLADLLLDAPLGTATSLGELERSALAEVGNLTVSYFLNAMSALTGKPLRPSPPAVMVDMLGAILDVVAVSAAATSDELLVVETMLREPEGSVQGRFWVMPDPAILA